MKITPLKPLLSLALFVAIANVDIAAGTNIASINIGADIPAIGINANQQRIINKDESALIDISQIIAIKARALNPSVVAANIPPIAADLRIVKRCVAVNDIDIQASLPIIL